MNHMTPDDGRAALIGIPEHRNLSVSAALHNEVVQALSKRLALAEKTIERVRAHRTHLGSSLLGQPDEYEAALDAYDAAKEAL